MTTETKPDIERFAPPEAAARAATLVTHALEQGYAVSVHDGEEYVLRKSTDFAAIWQAMGSTDADTLQLYRDGRSAGWVLLIWCNGVDVISDYTVDLDDLAEGVMKAHGDL